MSHDQFLIGIRSDTLGRFQDTLDTVHIPEKHVKIDVVRYMTIHVCTVHSILCVACSSKQLHGYIHTRMRGVEKLVCVLTVKMVVA